MGRCSMKTSHSSAVALSHSDVSILGKLSTVAAVYDRRFYSDSRRTCGLRATIKPAVIDRRYRMRVVVFAVVVVLMSGASLSAQDTRHVVEPAFPTACNVITAQLPVVEDRTLAEADEAKYDTRRIQQAIDACPSGQAVKLVAVGANSAFLS